MLNAEIKKELDVLVGAIDERIDKKIDERKLKHKKVYSITLPKLTFKRSWPTQLIRTKDIVNGN